jgi:ABC-2 type transport system permease protein
MSTFITLVGSNFLMLIRQRMLIITSLGIAVLSMLIFGGLFGGNGTPKTQLGIVDQDHSQTSEQIINALQHTNSLAVFTGSYAEEQQALKDGNRDAIIILGNGFGAHLAQGGAHIPVYYNQSSPITAATARLAVSSVVNGFNRSVTHQTAPFTLDEQGVASKNLRTIDVLTPGMLGMLVMWANLAVGTQLVLWREMGITKRLAATPLRPMAMIGAQVVAHLALSLVQGAIVLVVAVEVFNVQIYGSLWLVALLFVLGALSMLAIGFAIASFVRKSQAAQPITLLISFPMMFLGGSYFPVNGVTGFMQVLTHAMPLYYLNDALRQVINNGAGFAAIQTGVLILLAWIVASLLVTWRAFRWL